MSVTFLPASRLWLVLLTIVSVAACGTVAPSPAPRACASEVEVGLLPDWARAGFSDPEPTAPFAVGRSGEIAAIVFGGSLYSPPSPERSNKILWVAREPADAGPLSITAQRMDGSTPVGDPVERAVDGGPGPSTIDLPGAACWRMTLTWADRADYIDLEYLPPTASARRLTAA